MTTHRSARRLDRERTERSTGEPSTSHPVTEPTADSTALEWSK
ncbi:hypothetical protein [Natronorubrum thiooxidans]|nr:hypothetical protein [Natronorubrum thiooxidans]